MHIYANDGLYMEYIIIVFIHIQIRWCFIHAIDKFYTPIGTQFSFDEHGVKFQ